MTANFTTLFWDLDGTLTDPKNSIIGSYQKVLAEYGRSAPPEHDLLWVIGPPLRDCLKKLLSLEDAADIEAAVKRYRYWYVDQGMMYSDTPYPGIVAVLEALKERGMRMFVATAKAHSYARLILRHWKLEHFFEDVHGSELDGTRSNKAELLKWMLETYNLQPSRKISMIGDREHDAIAAKKNHLFSLGIGYGYGDQAELRAAGIDHYCADVPSLKDYLCPQP